MFLPSGHRVVLVVQCDDDGWSHLGSTPNRPGLQRHLWVLPVEALPIRLEFLHWDFHSIQVDPAFECVLGICSLFLTVLLFHLRMGKLIHYLSGWPILPLLWFFAFPNSLRNHILERFRVVLSCLIDEFWSFGEDGWYSTIAPKVLALSLVLQIVFHTVISRLPGGLEHFEDKQWHSVDSDHHFSSSPDCSNTADVPSFTRRMALSAMPFVSGRWGVEVRWFHDKTSHAFPNSFELSVYTTFWCFQRFQEF